MDIWRDKRLVLTLDAGRTNFVFSAVKGGKEIVKPITTPSNADKRDLCLPGIIDGFERILKSVKEKPAAISFAFPGPADYKHGIIGDLAHFPAFRGGVALGPMLEAHFQIPVFINNDGDLFAYGEALGGVLPAINRRLEEAQNPKRYKNLIGLTLGTGFGGGWVHDGTLFVGDNSIATEVWLMSTRLFPDRFAEEGISARAIQRVFLERASKDYAKDISPKAIYDIAADADNPDRDAARLAFAQFGRCLGDSLANLLTIADGIAVMGGGLTGAREWYMPALMRELHAQCYAADGKALPRLVQRVYDIDDTDQFREFVTDRSKAIPIPGTDRTVRYDPEPVLAVCSSKLGASKAIGVGAYAFALKHI